MSIDMKRLQDCGIHHSGIIVEDLDGTIKRLRELYEINVEDSYVFTPRRAWSYGNEMRECSLKICMVEFPDHQRIELIQPVTEEGLHRDYIRSGNSGMHHICYCVDEYDDWYDYLKKSNVDFIFESETEDDQIGFRRCFYVWDPIIGFIIEIKEKPYFRRSENC